jgi:rRNA processing protein Gar1
MYTLGEDGTVLHRAASENHCRRTKRQPPKNYSFILSNLYRVGILFVVLIALFTFLLT